MLVDVSGKRGKPSLYGDIAAHVEFTKPRYMSVHHFVNHACHQLLMREKQAEKKV